MHKNTRFPGQRPAIVLFLLLAATFFWLWPVTGVKADPLPEPTPLPVISFRLDGECTGDMVYVKLEGESTFETLTALAAAGRLQQSGNEYSTDPAIISASVYIVYDPAKQMLQSEITGTSEDTATVVTAGKTYGIQIDPVIHTITWAYTEEAYGTDAWLEHGRAEVIAIEGISDFHDIPFANNPGDDKGGHIAVDMGKEVTIRLIPDYGYQLAGVQLNGGATLRAQEEMYTFTFTMPDTNVHFKGIFAKTEDQTRISTQSQSLASVAIENGANAISSGTLQLTAADNTTYNVAAVQQSVDGAVAAQAVELDLSQVIAKGDGTSWEKEIHEFTEPVTLSLKINNYDASYDYVVVRDHEGTITALETKGNDGNVTFETNRFSTYIIVKKEKNSGNTTPEPAVTPEPPKTSDAPMASEASEDDDDDTPVLTPTPTPTVQELDEVPKTGDDSSVWQAEVWLLFGGIVLSSAGILLKKKCGNAN